MEQVRETVIATAVVVLFTTVLFAGSRWLPGRLVEGALLTDGRRETYRLNGMPLFALVVAALCLTWFLRPAWSAYPSTHFSTLFWTANVFAITASILLYVKGASGTAEGGRRRVLTAVRECFLGTELNPRLWGVELKTFSYRPSLIALLVFNVSFAAAQKAEYGSLSARMILYQLLFFLYIASYFQYERLIVQMWDVIAERFGWMLVWGDYVLVPFFYCLPAATLRDLREPLSPWLGGVSVALFVGGFWLFRGANAQKFRFKTDPAARIWGRPAQSLDGRLLVSGFWGIGRKLNYTGELMVYLSWTVLCGFASPVPYAVPLFLVVLLVHRACRDERRCKAKYGALWDEYCGRARFRMLPYLF
ncbi:DUF1295 domain-containing protein [Embleya sp. NPDC127516]|uniref:DUF1295 domain-containing protein n=1 Tax=Embleya sp. NPDC127516 TaxID=3363990 RepID=UPI003817C235